MRGEAVSQREIASLLMVDPFSSDAEKINKYAFDVGYCAAKGKMHVFGQIGVDNTVCPVNSKYCPFALDNFRLQGEFSESLKLRIAEHNKCSKLSSEEFVYHLHSFNEAKVDAVSLVGTAALPFNEYLDFVVTARNILNPEIGVIVNYRDMTLDDLSRLKVAGATCVYHSLRIREGEITGANPNLRRQTIKNVKLIRFDLMNGVEPVWEPFDEALAMDIADRILEVASNNPWATGVCGLCEVDGINFEGKTPSVERVQLVASILRLVCGLKVPIGCVGGVAWVDVGQDPRERGYSDSREHIIRETEKARVAMSSKGWHLY